MRAFGRPLGLTVLPCGVGYPTVAMRAAYHGLGAMVFPYRAPLGRAILLLTDGYRAP